eukprot:2946040-Amphidinium_carterae.1
MSFGTDFTAELSQAWGVDPVMNWGTLHAVCRGLQKSTRWQFQYVKDRVFAVNLDLCSLVWTVTSEAKIVPPPASPKFPRTKRKKNSNDQKHQQNKQLLNFISHVCSCGFGAFWRWR